MKKYALVFLSVFLFISAPFAAYANIVTATGKYIINAVKHAPGGAKVEATNTATAAKHVIKHGVSSADLGKSIGAGIVGFAVGTGAGLAFKAITGLALDAVDWVMDPANNAVKYTVPNPDSASTAQYLWASAGVNFATANLACANELKLFKDAFSGYSKSTVTTNITGEMSANCVIHKYYDDGSYAGDNTYQIGAVVNPAYNPDAPTTEQKSIPLNTLAQKILQLADAGNAAAQIDIEIHVTNIAQNGDLDIELDNATDITQPENPEEPNPDEPQQCPSGTVKVDNVCVKIPDSDSDEPLFCDSSEFTKKVCDWIDWTQEEPEEVTPVNIDIKEVDAENSNKIDMAGECPSPYELNFAVLGYEQNHSISYEPLCGALVLLKPIFVGSGALSGMFILMGYSRASNTGVN